MGDESTRLRRWALIGLRVWVVIGVLILASAAGWALGRVLSALVPFGFGLLIVLLLRRPVDLLESRGLNRTGAVVVCYLAAFAGLAVALTFVIPPVYVQIVAFMQALPEWARRGFMLWNDYIADPRVGSGVPAWIQNAALALRDQVVAGAGKWSTIFAEAAVATGGSIAGGVVGFILALIIGFYALVDLRRVTEEIILLAGPSLREEMTHVFGTVSRVLGGWLRGTLIQSTVVAVLIALGLFVAGVRDYALAIGVLGGVFNVVPYAGPMMTALLAAAAGLFVSPWAALWAVVVVFVVMQIDSLFLAPRIMSEQVDLHPLLVILALLLGAALFGVAGMVLSVPVAAIIKGLFVYWYERRTSTRVCTDNGVLFRDSADTAPDGGAASE